MKQRLLSLDALRGLTIAGMILVNSAGSWSHVYPPLAHVAWNGLALADVIFPLFMFMMGVSMYISLRKFSFTLHRGLFLKIVRRTCVLFLLGTFIYGAGTLLGLLREAYGSGGSGEFDWSSLTHIRLSGVLQRLAVCYFVGALLVTTVRHRYIPYWVVGMLVLYSVVLFLGNGFVYGPDNLLSETDRWLLGLSHMYNDNGIDSEGVLSTLPSVAHVLIGFCFGRLYFEKRGLKDKPTCLFLYGSILLLAGFLLQDLCPLNKKVWSPTFVLVTCGFSALLLGIFSWYMDVTRQWRRVRFLTVFGVNPLFCYVLSELLYLLADGFPLQGRSLHGTAYAALSAWTGDATFASLLYALIFVVTVWVVGWYLYKKGIYIKI